MGPGDESGPVCVSVQGRSRLPRLASEAGIGGYMKLRTIFVLCALATTAVYSTAYAAPDDDDPCVRADRTGSTKDAQECIDGQESEASKQRRRDQCAGR